MNEVKRYDVPLYSYDLVSQIREIPNGDFVLYKDYEYLSAQLAEAQGEISKLHTSIEEYEIENDKWRNYYNNLKQENAALRAELAEKEAELAKLKRQREQTEFDFRNLDKMHSVIIERHNGLLKENAELRGRLKRVDHILNRPSDRGHYCDYRVAVEGARQAIKAACEKGE